MKVRHSDSLLLIWRLAELEARQLGASSIEPTIDDEMRDDLLEHLGAKPERLRKVAKREVTFPWAGEKPAPAGRN